MSGKRFFAALGQSDASRGYRLPIHRTRSWPYWAWHTYADAWMRAQR